MTEKPRFRTSLGRIGLCAGLVALVVGGSVTSADASADPAKLKTAAAVVKYLKANGVSCVGLKSIGSDSYGGRYSRCSTGSGDVTFRVYPSIDAQRRARLSATGAQWAMSHCGSSAKRIPVHQITYGLWRLETTSTAVKDAVVTILDLKQEWAKGKGLAKLVCG